MFLSPTNMTTGMSVTSANKTPGAAGFLLDQFPGADVAFSLRRLRTGYGGPILRLRRAVDAEEADVHFDARMGFSLDSPVDNFSSGSNATNLGEFVDGAGYANPDGISTPSNGYMRTWYDQSGNGRNAEQSSTSYQPRPIYLGALSYGYTADKEKGAPAMYLSTDPMDVAQWGTIAHPNSISVVGADTSAGSGGNKYFWEGTTSSTRNILGSFYNNDDSGIYAGGSDYTLIVDSNKTAGSKIWFAVWNGTRSVFLLNNEEAAGTTGDNDQYGARLFARYTGTSNSMSGYVNEVVWWPTDQRPVSGATSDALNQFYNRF
tara:strand:- start:122 stop:1075 length:954 start_codon:yes stop_codon:yes gene_type:complete